MPSLNDLDSGMYYRKTAHALSIRTSFHQAFQAGRSCDKGIRPAGTPDQMPPRFFSLRVGTHELATDYL